MAFKLSLISDVRSAVKGAGDVAKALEDTADVLDDVARDASKTGDKVGDELRDGARQAEQSGEKLERTFRDALDAVKRDSKKVGDDLGDNVKRGARDAERAVDSFKDEARQNFAETASSFDGSMDSVADMAQSTLGGLATAIPGAGIALAGLGAAAGVFYEQWKDNAEKTRQVIADMFDDMVASGRAYASEDRITENLRKIYTDAEDAEIKLGEVRDIAARTGMTQERVALAFSEDTTAQTELLAALAAAQEDVNATLAASGYPEGVANSTTSTLTGWRDHLISLQREQQTATDLWGSYASAAGQAMTDAAAQVSAKFPLVQPPPLLVRVQTPTAAEVQGQFATMLRGVVLPPISIRARPGVEYP